MKFWNCFLFLTLTLTVLLSAACSLQQSPGNVVDGLGRQVTVNAIPQRIVSLAPSNTEILFALDLGDNVVGVTEYCNYPAAAQNKPKVGGFSTVDLEKVVSLNPDLVLATRRHAKTVIPALEKLGITVVALNPGSLDDVLSSITLVGRITGQAQRASDLVQEMAGRITQITGKTQDLDNKQRPSVFYVTWHDPLWTAGQGTLSNDLIEQAGGQNIASDITGDNTINLETVISRDPEIIIVSVGMGTGEDLPWQYIKSEPRLKNVRAIVDSRVYKIDGDLIDRPGPRSVDALEELAGYIHPELFKENGVTK